MTWTTESWLGGYRNTAFEGRRACQGHSLVLSIKQGNSSSSNPGATFRKCESRLDEREREGERLTEGIAELEGVVLGPLCIDLRVGFGGDSPGVQVAHLVLVGRDVHGDHQKLEEGSAEELESRASGNGHLLSLC